jgi:D-3-phosphoglycerate dehydrogenase
VPGVIGQVGTLLASYGVNIGEWRLGRDKPGGEALSFINLDAEPSAEVLQELGKIEAVTQAKVVRL